MNWFMSFCFGIAFVMIIDAIASYLEAIANEIEVNTEERRAKLEKNKANTIQEAK